MAEENKGQEPEQELEQEPAEGEEPVQEPEENPQTDEPEEEKRPGLLMPVLYALMAAAAAFTLAMVAGILLTFFFQPVEPAETPSGESSAQVTLTPSPDVVETQEPPGGDGDTGGDAPE